MYVCSSLFTLACCSTAVPHAEQNAVIRIANQGLPAAVSDSGEVELECSVVSYSWSKEDGTLSDPVVVELEGMCPTVISGVICTSSA